MKVTIRKILSFIMLSALAPVVSANNVYELTLQPGQSAWLSNNLGQALSAQCLILTTSKNDHSIYIKLYNGSGVFQGTTMSKGQSMVYSLKNLQMISLVADHQVVAEIQNLASYTVIAQCRKV